MIVYNLQCQKGHVFEEWFSSSSEYDEKSKKRKLACPECGNKKVSKAIMAPNVASSAGKAPDMGPCGQPVCGTGCPAMGS
ncbi:MAG: DUF1178 family protein [Rhodospirillales bacterium]|jgi:hypothetical protein|nr:DUF1178 family protein [Rhodospirillales bacterium]